MDFITYINKQGVFKTAECEYDSGDSSIMTIDPIKENYLVTSIFVDSKKRKVKDFRISAVQLAVINDDNFDGNLLDENHYSIEGTYFHNQLLPLDSVGSSAPLSVLKHDVDVKSVPRNRYTQVYRKPTLVPVSFVRDGSPYPLWDTPVIRLLFTVQVYTDGRFGVISYDLMNNYDCSITTHGISGTGMVFNSSAAYCYNSMYFKFSTTWSAPFDLRKCYVASVYINPKTNEVGMSVFKNDGNSTYGVQLIHPSTMVGSIPFPSVSNGFKTGTDDGFFACQVSSEFF
jgi:hypothetical protein